MTEIHSSITLGHVECPDTPLDATGLEHLPGPEQKILRALLENPEGVSTEDLAARAGTAKTLADDVHAIGDSVDLGTMKFRAALATFMEMRKPFLRPKTYRENEYCAKSLNKYFGHLSPNDITAMHIRRFQIARRENCGPSMINHELSLMQQLLKQCGTWDRVKLGYKPLPLPKEGPGRAISDDEEHRLLRAGAANPQWEDVYFFCLLSLNTTMGPGEVMTLRRKDIDLEKQTLTVNPEGAKNSARVRTIPLNDISLRTCKEVLSVAEKKGSTLPEHYIFPFMSKGGQRPVHDPTRRRTTFKTAWKKLLAFAGIESLRLYDLRHSSLTRLCEDPTVSEETVEAIAGHITHQMKKRYSHVRLEARRSALAGLVPSRLDRSQMPGERDDSGKAQKKTGKQLTNQDVLSMAEAGLPAKVIVAKIERSAAAYDTAPETLKALKQSGIPDAVILAMVKS